MRLELKIRSGIATITGKVRQKIPFKLGYQVREKKQDVVIGYSSMANQRAASQSCLADDKVEPKPRVGERPVPFYLLWGSANSPEASGN
jgi:hypothetical protein